VAPATNSGDHHHGEFRDAIYVVVGGMPVCVFPEDDRRGADRDAARCGLLFVAALLRAPRDNPSADEPARRPSIALPLQDGIVVTCLVCGLPME